MPGAAERPPPTPPARGNARTPRVPALPALPARPRARAPGARTFEDPRRAGGALPPAAASRRGHGAQEREPEARGCRRPGRRTLTRADPAASVLARAAPSQAPGRTSGRRPGPGSEGPTPARGRRRGSGWPRPRGDAAAGGRARRKEEGRGGNPFGSPYRREEAGEKAELPGRAGAAALRKWEVLSGPENPLLPSSAAENNSRIRATLYGAVDMPNIHCHSTPPRPVQNKTKKEKKNL